ncbi:hypothetical protein PGT21_015516 [Puccinia graminis f. sp. tritici]|uniref:Uncharacterized protein n=2 Tax=Puccinia graminis f. sp. tritici TaxID=56615 RepID=A0A5B0P737_PUCGR|nr:hypothetical protein PGT21_015516 [Puccinia graminis f. sp. tritici]
MVVLSKGLLLCLVWHVTGPNLFALSTLVHEAEESIGRPPVVLNDQNAYRLTLLDENELDQHYPSEYGSIPQEQAERKAEIESMKNEHEKIKKRIKLLKALPGQPSKAKVLLKELHKNLDIPMKERFSRLKLTPTQSPETSFNLVEDTSELENTWNALQTQLIRTVYSKKHVEPDEADFVLEFTKSFFLLGDYIYKYGLLPAPFIKQIEIFHGPTIFDIISRHINYMFRGNQGNFFDHAESVIPQLEFLKTAPSVKHFHRTIKGQAFHVIIFF